MIHSKKRVQLERLEAGIRESMAAIEVGRKVVPFAMAAVVLAGIVLISVVIGSIGFDPAAVAGVTIALLIGIVFLAWHRRKLTLMAAVLKTVEAHKAELAGMIDLPPPGDERP